MISSDFLADIPFQKPVYIYGSGKTAEMVYQIMRSQRQDIEVLAFIDSFKEGCFLSKPLLSAQAFLREAVIEEAFVLLASVDRHSISQMLLKLDTIKNQILIPVRLNQSVYVPAELDRLKAVQRRLVFGAHIFELLVHARQTWQLDAVYQYFCQYIKGKKQPYLDGAQIEPGHIVLDGGTFDGTEAMMFAELASPQKVYTFDPWGVQYLKHPEVFGENKSIEMIDKALWDHTGPVFFSANDSAKEHAAGSYVSARQQGHQQSVAGITIDEFVQQKKLKKVDFIKMDIEGAEPQALIGARETIVRDKPNMAICVYHDSRHVYQIPEWVLSVVPDYHLGFEHYSAGLGESILYCSVKSFESSAS